MKIAIISDIHENFHNLLLALEKIQEAGVAQIICLGDLMNLGIAKVLSIQNIPTYLIWGNNDGEKVEIMNVAHSPNSKLSISVNTYDFLEFDQRKIFICHYDDLAIPMAKSKLYDAVFYGHNHIKSKEQIENCLVVNPGEIAAIKTGLASFAIYDTIENTAELITLENSISLKSEKVSAYFKEHRAQLGFRSEQAFGMNES